MRLLTVSIFVAAGFTVLEPSAMASAVIVPPQLIPGDTYRLVFVTSTSRDGTSTDINAYNQLIIDAVSNNPSLLALGATWKAIASTATVDARDNIGGVNPTPIFNLAGQLVALGTSVLWSTGAPTYSLTLSNAVQYDENGTDMNNAFTWTGTGPDGLRDVELGAPGHNSSGGLSGQIDNLWIDSASTFNGFGASPGVGWYSFYGISSELTVAGAPEPVSTSLTLAGVVLLLTRRRLSKNR